MNSWDIHPEGQALDASSKVEKNHLNPWNIHFEGQARGIVHSGSKNY